MPPQNILNAPTKLMKDIGYGQGYAYDHDVEEGFSGDNYWPEEMTAETFYRPAGRGFEKRIAERIAWWNELREKRNAGESATLQPLRGYRLVGCKGQQAQGSSRGALRRRQCCAGHHPTSGKGRVPQRDRKRVV